RRAVAARGARFPEIARRPQVRPLGPGVEGEGHTHQEEQAAEAAGREARADPRRTKEGVRSEEDRGRLEIAGRALADIELVDPPGLERCARVDARAERRGKPLHLVEVAQRPE